MSLFSLTKFDLKFSYFRMRPLKRSVCKNRFLHADFLSGSHAKMPPLYIFFSSPSALISLPPLQFFSTHLLSLSPHLSYYYLLSSLSLFLSLSLLSPLSLSSLLSLSERAPAALSRGGDGVGGRRIRQRCPRERLQLRRRQRVADPAERSIFSRGSLKRPVYKNRFIFRCRLFKRPTCENSFAC